MPPSPVARLDLRAVGAPDRVAGVVLLLHGGRETSREPVRRTNLPAARMRPFAAAIRRGGRAAEIAVGLVRNRYRGWNGADADALTDARWALDQVAVMHGPVPVVLVGHSMGGRAAVRAAGHESVTAVAALCPWLPGDEPVEQLAGRAVLIAHAVHDRVTDPAASWEYARRAMPIAATLEYRRIERGGHAMLRAAPAWHHLVTDFTLHHLGVSVTP